VLGTQPSTQRAEPRSDEPVAEHLGINIHAKQSIDGRDRRQLERLCRYITRPPVAQDRLARLPDCPTARSSSRSSTRGRTVRAPSCSSPTTSWVRLVAAVPPPRWHLLRYFGILSSHSRLRREVVPCPPADVPLIEPISHSCRLVMSRTR
jgi:hypothetical protein